MIKCRQKKSGWKTDTIPTMSLKALGTWGWMKRAVAWPLEQAAADKDAMYSDGQNWAKKQTLKYLNVLSNISFPEKKSYMILTIERK